jgi:ribosomal protein S18 acetylase RimI-like enzyme
MAEFYVNISDESISTQIAEMLNRHNRLNIFHNSASILNQPMNYYVELAFPRTVVACVALQTMYNYSYIRHVCVLPEYRGMGISKKLLKKVLTNAKRGHIFMSIREDNIPSIKMALSLGFNFVDKTWSNSGGHFVVRVGRII